MYLSLTDYIQHKYAPGEPEAGAPILEKRWRRPTVPRPPRQCLEGPLGDCANNLVLANLCGAGCTRRLAARLGPTQPSRRRDLRRSLLEATRRHGKKAE